MRRSEKVKYLQKSMAYTRFHLKNAECRVLVKQIEEME